MPAPKKRGSLRRAKLACSRRSVLSDEEQLFNKKQAKFEIPIYISHARPPKERVPEEAEIGVFPKSFDFFTRPQGARTPDPPPHTNPGLRPYTPPVKNIPGGYPHLPQISYCYIIITLLLLDHHYIIANGY